MKKIVSTVLLILIKLTQTHCILITVTNMVKLILNFIFHEERDKNAFSEKNLQKNEVA